MYNYNEVDDKKERRKIISIATAVAVLILVLVVAIIVVATGKSTGKNLGGDENASFVIEETTEESESSESEESEGSTLGTITTDTVVVEKPTTDKAPEAMPDTGPADLLPIALLLGGLTTAGTTVLMRKR